MVSLSQFLRDQHLGVVSELRAKYGENLNLGSVPSAEWDAIGDLGFDAAWLMGVWERSPLASQSPIETTICYRISRVRSLTFVRTTTRLTIGTKSFPL
jgi:hypothetical protein